MKPITITFPLVQRLYFDLHEDDEALNFDN